MLFLKGNLWHSIPMYHREYKKVAFFGASRGLGREFLKLTLEKQPGVQVLAISRKPELAQEVHPEVRVHRCDFSQQDQWRACVQAVKDFNPDLLIYFAAGGPYGRFESKEWKDHQWALNVTLLFPTFLLHQLGKQRPAQTVLIGSEIAENKADPNATSYSISKHGLVGLSRNLKAENPQWDIRHFSPPYMKTDMLPANSPPVLKGLAVEPREIAQKLWDDLQSR